MAEQAPSAAIDAMGRCLPTAIAVGIMLLIVRAYLFRPSAGRIGAQPGHTFPAAPQPSTPQPSSISRVVADTRRRSFSRGTMSRARPLPAARKSARGDDEELVFMMRTADAHLCASVGGVHQNGRSCKLPCNRRGEEQASVARPEVLGAPTSPQPARAQLRWRDDAGNFTGGWSRAVRASQLHSCDSTRPMLCGFAAPSAFDAARRETARAGERCRIVVLTALLGSLDQLRDPLHTPTADTANCYFAFVDKKASVGLARRRAGARTRHGEYGASTALPRIGAWSLVALGDELPFGENARHNSRVPKMLPHRFFPAAEFCLWVDAKLQLKVLPEVAVERFLLTPRAEFAALRNLRRQTIDHEHAWITSWLCPRDGTAPEACVAVRDQWKNYASEQSEQPEWQSGTDVIEGALLILDLRSRTTQCLLCNWFNEYSATSERDQLSFAYVLHVQQPRPRVNLIARRWHWSAALERDTASCYNATTETVSEIAVRFQHGRGVTLPRRQGVSPGAGGKRAAAV